MKSERLVKQSQGFVPCAQVQFFHEYFNGGAYSEVECVPTPATSDAMRKLGLVARRDQNHVRVYYNEDPPPSQDQLNDLSLIYALEFTNNEFSVFSDLPLRDRFSLLLSPVGINKSVGRLTSNESLSEADFVRITGLRFDYRLSKDSVSFAGKSFALRNGKNIVVQEAAPTDGVLRFDVTAHGPGVYQLFNSTSLVDTFLAEPSFSLASPTCALVLPGSALHCQPSAEDRLAPTYSAQFPARKTVWRYDVFIPGASAKGASFTINEHPPEQVLSTGSSLSAGLTNGLVKFRTVEGILGPLNQKSVAFESDLAQPIPMRARPPHRYQLLRNGEVFIENLATPGTNFTRASDGKTLCSQMLIYT